MKYARLIFRNLIHYRRTNLPVIVGVAAAVAVLTGALLVGQSVRRSLRDLLFERIGSTEYSVTADHFFSEKLSDAFRIQNNSCPLIYLKGIVMHESSGIRVHNVNVYGVDERFWQFHGMDIMEFPDNRSVFVGMPLAKQLSAADGDALILQVENPQAIPREWLYGRRDNVGRSIRLNCRRILTRHQLGEFSLRPTQGTVHSIFVPIKRLQRDLDKSSSANIILLAPNSPSDGPESIADLLRTHCSLSDLGLKLRSTASGLGFSLDSHRIILNDSLASAALEAADDLHIKASPVYTYLANSIRSGDRSIPYSVIAAADLGEGSLVSVEELPLSPSGAEQPDKDEEIRLTDWAWRDLDISIGDPVEVDYYLWQDEGQLITRTARFKLAGVVSTSGDVDEILAPDIPGITEARSISDWDPPFPLDLSLIRQKDEDYWNRFRATPKAFIRLSKGRELWQNRFGTLTSLRFALPEGAELEMVQKEFSQALLEKLNPLEAGISIHPVKEQGLLSARGSTNFGEYFVYFSFFLIAAAMLLAALFFRLMVEQRVKEIGLLRAAGFRLSTLRNMLFLEGSILSVCGGLLGLLGALAYGGLMVLGLRTWWIGAVGTERLNLHISWMDLTIGILAGLLFSMATIFWTLRDLSHNSPRSLLAGVLESAKVRSRRTRSLKMAAVITLLAAVFLLLGAATGTVSELVGFFGTGFLMLVSILCATSVYLRRSNPRPIHGRGWAAHFRLGMRNAMVRPGRSLLCASLIAAATFIIVSMEAFRQSASEESLGLKSGTGGYAYLAESDLPVSHDLNTEVGREASGISSSQIPGIANISFTPFRVRPGDDASCLNLYAPQDPKVFGVPPSFIAAERFSFQDSIFTNPEEAQNPWLLLNAPIENGAIPAIADATTIQYILHLSLGSELTVSGGPEGEVRLRLVAALDSSILQGALLISESNFLRAFPEHQGNRFFLLDTPDASEAIPIQELKEGLSDLGFNIESSLERLESYHRVENTYLSTFQSLGSLGLILGTIGLAAVLLRNALERRKELALLNAVGFRRRILAGIILSENVLLMIWGLTAGSLCAFLAIMPALHARGTAFPLAMTGLIMVTVLATGLVSSIFAVVAAFRSPLLKAIQSE